MPQRGTVIRVLLVDDSALARLHVRHAIEMAPDMQVVGAAANGLDAVLLAKQVKPDVITMDLDMPGVDGYAATRSIMETAPIPIVVVSGLSDVTAKAVTMRALEAGAVAVLARPPALSHPEYARSCSELQDTIRACSEVRLVRRYRPKGTRSGAQPTPMVSPGQGEQVREQVRLTHRAVVAIGASTGGPVAILELLKGLPAHFPLPICVVQHIAAGFTESMAQWLDRALAIDVAVAASGEQLRPGRVLLAPHGSHMVVHGAGQIRLVDAAPEHGMIPSVSTLFRSVAQNFGAQSVGALLTGMGADGAAELGQLRRAGAATFAQDAASSLVFGMPGEAVQLGAAVHVLPPAAIAAELCRMTAHL